MSADLLDAYLWAERQIPKEPRMSGIPESTLAQEIEKVEPMTVGVLRKAIEGAADDTPVIFHLGDDAFMLKPDDWFFYTRPSEAFCITFAYPPYMTIKEKK